MLVGPAGEPVAERAVDVRASVRSASGEELREESNGFRTGRDGSFEVFLRTPVDSEITRLSFTTDPAYEGPTLSARVDRETWPEGGVDLGRVTLEPPPVALSGRVVDAAGEPVHWAGIWVKRMTDLPHGPPYHWVDAWQTNYARRRDLPAPG